jgi:LysR family glycine cleavage system transcriptional activator
MTLTRPLVDAGLLMPLFDARLKAEYAHYLVYPPRSRSHRGLADFGDWLLAEARDYESQPTPAPKKTPRKQAGR